MNEQHKADIINRFSYHPPKDGQPDVYEGIRGQARDYALFLEMVVPDGREKALALTKLEECVMWANAGIARG